MYENFIEDRKTEVNKYNTFIEYLQENYIELINEALIRFIVKKRLNKEVDQSGIIYHAYEINEIRITNVQFTKSEMEKVAFHIYFNASFNLIDESTNPCFIIEENTSFILPMKGSFQSGFIPYQGVKISEEMDCFSDQLVPIIHNEEMDKYATKFLKFFCPEALETPMKIDVNAILKKQGIDIYFAPLEPNVYGKIYFAKDIVTIYENDNLDDLRKQIIKKEIQAGTILIHWDKTFQRPASAYRNTIIHEAVHWFFHRNYFELRHLLDYEQNCMVCYKADGIIAEKEINWMEWQARTLGPKILMPKKMALRKFAEISKEAEEKAKEKNFTDIQKWTYIFEQFRDFFGVSNVSTRIRLLELGKTRMDGIKNYIDDRYVQPYLFKEGTLKARQTFCISKGQLNTIVQSSFFIKNALMKEQVIYTNSMLVLNNPKYYDVEKGTMTTYALNNAHECCLIFDIQPKSLDSRCAYSKQYYLYNKESVNKCDITLNQAHANQIFKLASEGNKHFEEHQSLLPKSFGETLKYHYLKAKENNLFKSYEDFEDASDVPERTIRQYIKGPYIPSREVVIKLCLGLRLSSRYFMDMLEKAEHPISCTYGENSIIFTIIFGYERQGLDETYKGLESVGKGYLLNLSSKWIRNHITNE